MSQTRHADPAAPVSQERYLSSPEFAETRGISAAALAARAELLESPACRSLLFFLQALSLKPGGLKSFCADFLALFPDRLGTPTMRRLGHHHGKPYSPEVTRQIEGELDPRGVSTSRRREQLAEDAAIARSLRYPAVDEDSPLPAATACKPRSHESFLDQCRALARHLGLFITDLCINPRLQFAAPGEDAPEGEGERAALPWFHDIIGALFEFKRRYEETAARDFVMTQAARQTFDVLDVGLRTGKMVVIEGESGIGKTTAAEAWCNQHLGEARFISLSGISHKTGMFRSLARALGIGSSLAKSSTEIQSRIEMILQRSRLMVVIDEAHFLFSAGERVYSRPELVDWIDTALCNQGIPCALLVTRQFAVRLDRVEKQTTWNADQFRRRVKRYCRLPAKPTTQDVRAIARKLLPAASSATIDFITGFALTCPRHLSAVVDLVDEARLLASRNRRDRVTFEDVETASREFCGPSYAAMSRQFAAPAGRRRSRRSLAAGELTAPPPATRGAAAAPPRRTNLTGLAPVAAPSGNHPAAFNVRPRIGEPVEV